MAIWQNGRYGAAQQYASPNCEARPVGEPVDLIVLHNISLPPFEYGSDAIARLFTNQIQTDQHPFFARGRCSSSCRAMIWRITQGFRNFTGGKNAIVFPSASSWRAVILSRLPKRNMPRCCPCCTIFARRIQLPPLLGIKILHRSGKPTRGIFLTGAGCNGAGCPSTGIPVHKFRVCQVCRLPANVKSVIIM